MKLITQSTVCLFIILLFCLDTSFAQKNSTGIYFVNGNSKIPVQDVTVLVDSGDITLISDANGFINIRQLPANCKKLFLSCTGYESLMFDISSITLRDNNTVVNLSPKVSSLSEIRIISSANREVYKTISDLDIHLRPINNSQEVLRMVPGLFIGQHAGGGKAEQIFLRGFDIDHGTDINISVDGIPVNMVSHAHGQGYADLHFVIPELIDKVNFNKGPYFADKGNFTTAGFAEFKTTDYLEDNFVKLEIGQFNTYRGVAGINLLKKQKYRRSQSLYFAGEASFTSGYFESSQDFNRFNGMLKYNGSLDNQNSITATLSSFTSKWNASGQIPNRKVTDGSIGFYGAIDNTEGGNTSRQNLNISLQSKLNNGGTFRNQLFYSMYDFELYSNFTFYKEDSINGDQVRQKEKRNILGFNSSYEKNGYLGKWRTETKTGIQIRYDDVNDIELTRTKNRTINTKQIKLGDINELNIAAYVQKKIAVSKKVDISIAIRADHFANRYADKLAINLLRSTSAILSPKLNFNYRVNDNVHLYLFNGRGFHSNDTRVAVQQKGRKVLPAAYGSDFGAMIKAGRKLVLQSALWYLWLQQEFVYVGDEGIVEVGGKTRRVGLDLSARYELIENLFADADISIADPRALNVIKSQSYLPLAPRFSSAGGLTYRKETGFNGSLRYRYMNDRPANESNSVVAKGYFVVDVSINFVKKKWQAGISIQNLFNTKWKETQFDTESKLQDEAIPVSEIHFTPGVPFFAKTSFTFNF